MAGTTLVAFGMGAVLLPFPLNCNMAPPLILAGLFAPFGRAAVGAGVGITCVILSPLALFIYEIFSIWVSLVTKP